MASQANRKERVMLRYHNIFDEDLKRADGIIWNHLKSNNWTFINPDKWAGVLVVHAKAGSSIN